MGFSSPEELMYVGELLATCGKVQRKVVTDATSARVIAVHEGVSGLRHVQTKCLWIQQKVKGGTLQVSTVPSKDNPADFDTKHLEGDDVQRFSEWINLKDEEKSEDVEEKRRPEAKAIGAPLGMSMALLDNRRRAILSSILTAASVASVKADMDIAATGHDVTETSWTWICQLFFAVAAIFATPLERHWVLEPREQNQSKLQQEEKALTAEYNEEARVKGSEERSRQTWREAMDIFMTGSGFYNSGMCHNTSVETADIVLGVRKRQRGARQGDVPSLSRSKQDSRHGDVETSALGMTHCSREQVNTV